MQVSKVKAKNVSCFFITKVLCSLSYHYYHSHKQDLLFHYVVLSSNGLQERKSPDHDVNCIYYKYDIHVYGNNEQNNTMIGAFDPWSTHRLYSVPHQSSSCN